MAVVSLDARETIVAESGSMVAMSDGLRVTTEFNGTGGGGLFDWIGAVFVALVRKFLAGETLFVNHFRAISEGQEVMLAPAMVGDVEQVELGNGRKVTVQATSFLASGSRVVVDLIWGGFQMLLSKEGAFFMRCSGEGPLLINAYGAIEKVVVDGSYVVDTGHLVAFEGSMTHRLKRVGNWKSTLLSGEGLVMEFKGQGTIWLQTRNMNALVGWIRPQLPK